MLLVPKDSKTVLKVIPRVFVCTCECSSSENAPHWFGELSNGLLLTQKVMAGFLALHTGRRVSHKYTSPMTLFILFLIFIYVLVMSFCQWQSLSATSTALSPCGERVLSATPGGASQYPWCKLRILSQSNTFSSITYLLKSTSSNFAEAISFYLTRKPLCARSQNFNKPASFREAKGVDEQLVNKVKLIKLISCRLIVLENLFSLLPSSAHAHCLCCKCGQQSLININMRLLMSKQNFLYN